MSISMSSPWSRACTARVVSTPWCRLLGENGHTYEQDGALWLRTTEFGDDKDRVMRKSDGGYTYFVPDIAYHLDKWQRGFTRVINEQGSDHHSTITRVRAGLQALNRGIPQGWPEYVLHQMVTVLRGGEEVKISKRAGSYVTLRDLIDEVGRDATRFFFIMRKPDSQLVFDIDLAKEQSPDNPVYYVQYAHARICSIFENARERALQRLSGRSLSAIAVLETAEELQLIKLLTALPETVDDSAQNFEPHRLTYYLTELAGCFHSFYNKNRVISEDATADRGPPLPAEAHRPDPEERPDHTGHIGTGTNVIPIWRQRCYQDVETPGEAGNGSDLTGIEYRSTHADRLQ